MTKKLTKTITLIFVVTGIVAAAIAVDHPAKGGGTWDYVQTGYVVCTLNRVFGYMWSFEVLTSLAEAAQIATSGTCVVKVGWPVLAGDKTLAKEQFGRYEVKFKTAYENGKKSG